jgi:ABC-type glycerol-3-phosphate transport system substrate-binding protein
MRFSRMSVVLVLALIVAITAATAGARVTGARSTTTITFWNAYSSDGPEVQRLNKVVIPYFEKTHPGIVVKDVPIPYDSLHQKLITAVAGGQLPDLVRTDIIWVPELANLGVLEALDKSMPDFKTFQKAVYPGPLATNYWKGHYYGLPLDTNTRTFNYSPTALQAAGLSSPPKTFAELKQDAATAKAKGLDLYAESGTSGWNLLPWIWSAGGSLTNSTYTKATGYLNSAKSVAGIQMLVDMYKAGEMPNIILGGNGGLGTYDGISQGKYVATLDGPWMFAIFGSAYKNTQVAGTTIPAGPGGSISVVGGEDINMTHTSKHKNEALQFLRFMDSPWAQNQMARAGQMPVIKSLTAKLVKIHPYYSIYLKQIATARPRTPSPHWNQIDQILQTEIAKAFKGDESVQQALTSAASQIDPLLQ